MDNTCYITAGVFAFIVLLWILLETHYFIQIIITIISARFFKKKVGILEETTYYGICLTTDVDVFFCHMNNSRYLREVDFARSDFYNRTRLYWKILERKGKVVVGANTVIYRRPIRPFVAYRITSKIVYWDKKSIFMEHHFITTRDAVVRATVFSQQCVIKCEADAILRELQGLETPTEKPAMPPEVARLIESIKSTTQHKCETSDALESQGQNKVNALSVIEDCNANGHVLS